MPIYPGLKKPPPTIGAIVNGFKYMGGDPRSQDTNVWAPVHGDDYLNSLPIDPDKRSLIQSIANYDLPPGSGRGGIGSPEVQQVLGFVKGYDPTFDAKNYKLRQDTLHDFVNSQTGTAGQLKNLANVSLHARDLQDAYDQMNLTSSAPLNWFNNEMARYFPMSDAMTARQGQLGRTEDAIGFLSPEAARLGQGAAPNQTDTADFKNTWSTETAPRIASGSLTDVAHKVVQRLLGIQDQWRRAFGDIKPKQPLVNRDAAIALHDLLTRYKLAGADQLDWNILTSGGFSPTQTRAIRGGSRQPAAASNAPPQKVVNYKRINGKLVPVP